jgi:hypothetical protein
MRETPGVKLEVIASIEDPWIQAYLQLRQAVVDGELTTLRQVKECARQVQRSMPERQPSPLVAAFITADIAITFPVVSDALRKP